MRSWFTVINRQDRGRTRRRSIAPRRGRDRQHHLRKSNNGSGAPRYYFEPLFLTQIEVVPRFSDRWSSLSSKDIPKTLTLNERSRFVRFHTERHEERELHQDKGHLRGRGGVARGVLPLEERPLRPSVRRLPRVGLGRGPRSSAAAAAVEELGPRTARRSEPRWARASAPRFEEGPAKLPNGARWADDTSATRAARARRASERDARDAGGHRSR